MRIVALSDTHQRHTGVTVPEGDLLIFAGDWGMAGDMNDARGFMAWLRPIARRFRHGAIVVAGNHDCGLDVGHPLGSGEISSMFWEDPDIEYLEDVPYMAGGYAVYGSPWTPRYKEWAFMEDRGSLAEKFWRHIPDSTEILVTHGPPRSILDNLPGFGHVGCDELAAELPRLQNLKLHVFGHIHGGYGRTCNDGTTFANVSVCDESYRAVNQPQVFDLPDKPGDWNKARDGE